MANAIRIKRRASGGSTGSPSQLLNAELAFNESDPDGGILYYGSGLSGGNAASIIAIGGSGAFVNLTGSQTVSGTKTFSGPCVFSGTGTNSAVGVTQSSSDDSTRLATTAYVKSVVSAAGGGTVTSVALSLPNIFTVSGSPVTSSGTLTGSLATQNANIVFAGPTTGGASAPTFRSLVAADIPSLTATKISDFDTQVRTSRLDQMAAPTGSVAFNSQKITGLADPTAAQDAATKAYVDATKQGLDVKDSVRAATTANITLSGTQTIDGVSVIAGDRVLVKNQSTGSQNGLYVAAAGSWSRSADADADAEVTAGLFVFVEEGTTNGDSGWVLTTNNPITVGTTALSFTQFSGAGSYAAGNGLTLTGSTFDVASTGGGSLTVTADSINLSSGVATPGTYRSVTVDTYGRITSGTTPTTFSGYGISDSSANLAAAITDETGTGALVFGTSPSLTTPSLSGETFSVGTAITAGTNAQGQGALTNDINVITTASASPSGVTLPTATTGRRIIIINRGANAINVYPATGAAIDGLSANAAIDIQANATMTFNASSTTQWYSDAVVDCGTF